jgi:micrococcal nuclease
MKSTILSTLISIFLIIVISLTVAAKEMPFQGEVVAVTDGDTIKVLHGGAAETIRLSGIDCPEKRQAFGNAARKFTSDFCFGKRVLIVPDTRDRYGRAVAQVVLPDGRALNHELLRAGYAWWYQKYAGDDLLLRQLEMDARSRRAGLWSDATPLAPWNFRRQRRNLTASNW